MKIKFKPVFPYYGGKFYMLKTLLKFIPEHNRYCEVFGGAGILLFNKKPVKIEIYNDLNNFLVCFFRVLRNKQKTKALQKLLHLTPYSRIEYFNAKQQLKNNKKLSEFKKAYYFFIAQYQGFSGAQTGWKYPTKSYKNPALAYFNKVKILHMYSERISNVIIENLDFREIFKRYISNWNYNDSFCYLDPPYILETRNAKGYLHEMINNDHRELVEFLLKYSDKCKFLVSGYDHPIYNKLVDNGWNKFTKKIPLFSKKTNKKFDKKIKERKFYGIIMI